MLVQNSTLRHYTLYQASDLSDCVKALHSLCCNASNSNLHAIREKYSQHKLWITTISLRVWIEVWDAFSPYILNQSYTSPLITSITSPVMIWFQKVLSTCLLWLHLTAMSYYMKHCAQWWYIRIKFTPNYYHEVCMGIISRIIWVTWKYWSSMNETLWKWIL